MKVCFLLQRGSPPRLNPVFASVFALLEMRGIEVEVLYPEEELLRLDTLAVEADLYMLKSNTDFAVSVATALEAMGARILNRCSASQLAKDKVVAAAILLRAGIAAPRSLVATSPAHLAPAAAGSPLILKPHRGYSGAGIMVVEEPAALPADDAYPDVVFAQQYLDRGRKDLKVFVIGDAVFGVRKDFSADSFLQAGVPCALTPEIEDIARRCGEAFGLELYGLDFVEDEEGPRVVDINYLPGYKGVPDAARRLAEYITHAVRG